MSSMPRKGKKHARQERVCAGTDFPYGFLCEIKTTPSMALPDQMLSKNN